MCQDSKNSPQQAPNTDNPAEPHPTIHDFDFTVESGAQAHDAILKLSPSGRIVVFPGLPPQVREAIGRDLLIRICNTLLIAPPLHCQHREGTGDEKRGKPLKHCQFRFPEDVAPNIPSWLLTKLIERLISQHRGATIPQTVHLGTEGQLRGEKTEQTIAKPTDEATPSLDTFLIHCRSILEHADALRLAEHTLCPKSTSDVPEFASNLRRLADALYPEKELISVDQAADMLAITPAAVRMRCQKGTLRSKKVGRDWLIPLDEVERLAAQRPSSE